MVNLVLASDTSDTMARYKRAESHASRFGQMERPKRRAPSPPLSGKHNDHNNDTDSHSSGIGGGDSIHDNELLPEAHTELNVWDTTSQTNIQVTHRPASTTTTTKSISECARVKVDEVETDEGFECHSVINIDCTTNDCTDDCPSVTVSLMTDSPTALTHQTNSQSIDTHLHPIDHSSSDVTIVGHRISRTAAVVRETNCTPRHVIHARKYLAHNIKPTRLTDWNLQDSEDSEHIDSLSPAEKLLKMKSLSVLKAAFSGKHQSSVSQDQERPGNTARHATQKESARHPSISSPSVTTSTTQLASQQFNPIKRSDANKVRQLWKQREKEANHDVSSNQLKGIHRHWWSTDSLSANLLANKFTAFNNDKAPTFQERAIDVPDSLKENVQQTVSQSTLDLTAHNKAWAESGNRRNMSHVFQNHYAPEPSHPTPWADPRTIRAAISRESIANLDQTRSKWESRVTQSRATTDAFSPVPMPNRLSDAHVSPQQDNTSALYTNMIMPQYSAQFAQYPHDQQPQQQQQSQQKQQHHQQQQSQQQQQQPSRRGTDPPPAAYENMGVGMQVRASRADSHHIRQHRAQSVDVVQKDIKENQQKEYEYRQERSNTPQTLSPAAFEHEKYLFLCYLKHHADTLPSMGFTVPRHVQQRLHQMPSLETPFVYLHQVDTEPLPVTNRVLQNPTIARNQPVITNNQPFNNHSLSPPNLTVNLNESYDSSKQSSLTNRSSNTQGRYVKNQARDNKWKRSTNIEYVDMQPNSVPENRKQRGEDIKQTDFPTDSEYRIALEIRELREREEELKRSRSERGLPSLEDEIDFWRRSVKGKTAPPIRVAQSMDHLHQLDDQNIINVPVPDYSNGNDAPPPLTKHRHFQTGSLDALHRLDAEQPPPPSSWLTKKQPPRIAAGGALLANDEMQYQRWSPRAPPTQPKPAPPPHNDQSVLQRSSRRMAEQFWSSNGRGTHLSTDDQTDVNDQGTFDRIEPQSYEHQPVEQRIQEEVREFRKRENELRAQRAVQNANVSHVQVSQPISVDNHKSHKPAKQRYVTNGYGHASVDQTGATVIRTYDDLYELSLKTANERND